MGSFRELLASLAAQLLLRFPLLLLCLEPLVAGRFALVHRVAAPAHRVLFASGVDRLLEVLNRLSIAGS